jgi:hypothetical protein
MRLLNVKKLSIQVKDDEHNYLVNMYLNLNWGLFFANLTYEFGLKSVNDFNNQIKEIAPSQLEINKITSHNYYTRK